jgi:hypothetical protein
VEEVLVGGPGLGGGLDDGNVLLGGKGEQVLATLETLIELCMRGYIKKDRKRARVLVELS